MVRISTVSLLSWKIAYLCQYLSGPRTGELATGVFCTWRAAEFQDLPGAGYPAVRSARDRSLLTRTRNVLGGIRPLGTRSGKCDRDRTPPGYLDMLSAMGHARKILTDFPAVWRRRPIF